MLCAPFIACCKPWPGVAEQLAQWQAVGARIGRVLGAYRARIGEPASVLNRLELCVMKCECDTGHACP